MSHCDTEFANHSFANVTAMCVMVVQSVAVRTGAAERISQSGKGIRRARLSAREMGRIETGYERDLGTFSGS